MKEEMYFQQKQSMQDECKKLRADLSTVSDKLNDTEQERKDIWDQMKQVGLGL